MRTQFKLPVITSAITLILALIAAHQPASAAGPWYVAPGGNNGNSCLSPAAACASINGALAKPGFVAGDTINVSSGTYFGSGSEVVLISTSATVSGGWDGSFTAQTGTSTIDGQGARRGLKVNNGVTAQIERFVIRNGMATNASGGGIYNAGILTVTDSSVSDNTTNGIYNDIGTVFLRGSHVDRNTSAPNGTSFPPDGGGLYNYWGNLILDDATVDDNNAASSGGGVMNYYGTVTVTRSWLGGNRANLGGGLFNFYGNMRIVRSVVDGNSVADSSGGGIYLNNGTLTVNNSTVSNNRAAYGAGIYIPGGGTVNINNSTISANRSSYQGGGINSSIYATLALNSSTVSGNSVSMNSSTYGGGIYSGGGALSLANTIVAGNTQSGPGGGPDCYGPLSSTGYNLIGTTLGCTYSASTGDLTGVTPQLGELVNSPGYYPLLSGSPAINAGNPAGCNGSEGALLTDQRGAARVGRCDIGAYEYTVPGPAARVAAQSGTPQRAAPLRTYRLPLQATVFDSIGSPVSGVTVTFAAPLAGPTGSFASGGAIAAVGDDQNGIATAPKFTANGLSGSYFVSATISSVVTPALFLLNNMAWYVTTAGSDSNDCLSPVSPCASINGALAKPAFVAYDTVLIAAGTYTSGSDPVVTISKTSTLNGGWNNSFDARIGVSTFDGQALRTGLIVNNGVSAIVDRFAVVHGVRMYGGAVSNYGNLNLNNSNVTASPGDGVYNGSAANLILDHSSITGNVGIGIVNDVGAHLTLNASIVGGNGRTGIEYDMQSSVIVSLSMIISNIGGIRERYGIACCSGTTLLVSQSTIAGNSFFGGGGTGGGGIYNAGVLTVTGSAIRGNSAGPMGRGGGIFSAGRATINSSSVTSNSALTGGGIDGSNVTLNNSTVSSNNASYGGGLYGAIALNSTTVANNSASQGGGIIAGITATIKNSLVAKNVAGTGPDCSGFVASLGYSLLGNTSGCMYTPGPGDLAGINPLVFPLIGSPGFHPLLPGSPAINAGNPAGCKDGAGNPLPADERGVARVGRCDIGAYEYDPNNDPLHYVLLPGVMRGF